MDLRENFPQDEETFRAAFAGLQKTVWTAMPCVITQDSADGHTCLSQPTIKREITDPVTGQITYEDHPVHPDVVIHHTSGGGVTITHPTKEGDEGINIYASRNIDSWHQSGGLQQPMDDRMHHLADAMYIPGVRSTPRKLQQVDPNAAQLRSDDKLHVVSHDPTTGTHIKSADPSTLPASPTFDPFAQATTFYEHLVQGATGVHHGAVDGGTAHTYDLTHAAGHILAALNGLHSVLAHPQNGASLNAENLLHQVLAHPTLGALLSAAGGQHIVQAHPQNGVLISSAKAIGFSAPSMSFPSGSIGGGSLGSGAAATNVGQLGGDLSGTLPNPQVVSIAHVTGANTLPNAANDSAAAALNVGVGALYRNGSALMVRVA